MYAEVIADALRRMYGEGVTLEGSVISFAVQGDFCLVIDVVVYQDSEDFTTAITNLYFAYDQSRYFDLRATRDYEKKLLELQRSVPYGRFEVDVFDDGVVAPYLRYMERYPFKEPTEPVLGQNLEEVIEGHRESIGVWYLNTFFCLFEEAQLALPTVRDISLGNKVHPEIGKFFEDPSDESGNRQFLM